ncbi:MAG: M20/M25/M40 family metallo-hydrolase [Xanthomonadales bacterium]|nr:M20/M25/M40 family metallo-hydrolase [Xanthomonadales bacterium]
MKRIAYTLILAAVVIVAVLVVRANTVFHENQPEPAPGLAAPALDESLALERFARALTYPTVSHDDRDRFDAEAFTAFHAFLAEAYPLVAERAERTVVNGYSLVYRLPGSDESLRPVLFMSHMDVVPVEESTRDQWSHPPFAGVVSDGIVWGRGSVDDKIGVISLMEAMEQLLREGKRLRRAVYFAFGHDEEVGGMDGAGEIAAYFQRLGLRFDFVLDEGGALTRGMIAGIERPLAVIGVSEKGYVNLELTVESPGGHSSQPPPQTAVGILSRAIVKVEDHPFPARLDYVLPTFEAVGSYMPFGTRMAMGNLWLLEPLVRRQLLGDPDSAAGIRTTTAATMFEGSPKSNILPTRAKAVVNFRILPGETVESVKERVIGLIDDPRVSVSAEFGIDPSPVSPLDTRGYELIASTIRGMDESALVAPYMVRGGTDAKYFYALSPNVYRFLMVRVDPDTIRYVHGIDERVPVADFLEAIRFYYHLIRRAAD